LPMIGMCMCPAPPSLPSPPLPSALPPGPLISLKKWERDGTGAGDNAAAPRSAGGGSGGVCGQAAAAAAAAAGTAAALRVGKKIGGAFVVKKSAAHRPARDVEGHGGSDGQGGRHGGSEGGSDGQGGAGSCQGVSQAAGQPIDLRRGEGGQGCGGGGHVCLQEDQELEVCLRVKCSAHAE